MTAERIEPFGATSAYEGSKAAVVAGELLGGRYQVTGEIGSGGMGVVLRTLDTCFDRPVAIKMLRSNQNVTAAAERRFLNEARITGQLQHPGIPPAHEIGRLDDGRSFFSMKLIEGRTLAELLAERLSPQTELPRFLKIFEQIAQTIAYAHSQGVIHRDLKPLNIMVGAFGEVQVMDWGLAKRLAQAALSEDSAGPTLPGEDGPVAVVHTAAVESDTADSHTQAGQILGTFAYMAPEQASGEVQSLRESCDVFGLGAILCTILTGGPPYLGISRTEVWRQAQIADLSDAWARLDVCGADAELVRLARSCLATKAQDRPCNAGQVAASVATHLASVQERLQQTRVAQAEAEVKAGEERKRRRLAVFLAATIVLLIVGASLFGLWYAKRDAETVARAEHLDREVAAALDEATRLRDDLHQRLRDPRKAAGLLSELHQWQTLLESAQSAWKRADTLALSGRELLAPDLQERLERVARQLKADEAERQVAFALDSLRFDAFNPAGQSNLPLRAPKLERIFGDAGYRVQEDPPEQTAARIRAATIWLPLVAGLDFWASDTSDRALHARLLEVARRADPHTWRDRFRQADVWNDRAKLRELADAVDLDEQSPQVLTALAQRLNRVGGSDPALVRRALVAHPSDFWLLFQLGMYNPNLEEQAGAFRAALAVRPQTPIVYYNLGFVLQSQQKPGEAAACYRKALEVDPSYADVYTNLGMVLDELGKPDEAHRFFLKATQLSPKNARTHINLGASLHAQGKYDEAIACYRKASEIEPKSTASLNNLGTALRMKNQLEEAADCYRKSIDIEGNNPFAWCNLGHILNIQGKFDEALTAMQRGHEQGSRLPDWRFPSAVWVLQTQRWVTMDKKLPAVLRGETAPSDASEGATLAEICFKHKKRHAAAFRLYTAAFASGPALANDLGSAHRYHAACAAALGAAGKGIDAAEMTAKQRADARRQALDWLRADLKAHADRLERRPADRAEIANVMQQWQTTPDLASVRDPGARAEFPSAEQSDWQRFWIDAAALRQQSVKAKS